MAPVRLDTDLPPALLGGKYVLGDCIGSGGMGRVYRAVQPELERTVAIKVMHRVLAEDERIARHFRTEAIAAAGFTHPNSVAVIDFGEADDGTPFLVMEYVDGRSLSRIVRDEAPLELPRAVTLILQLLDALGDAHARGIVHADVKSDNVLVEATRDRGEQAKLVDFGLARVSCAGRVGPDANDDWCGCADGAGFDDDFISGTPEYMAPELIGGAPPSPASDLYALGALLHELLTGTTPFAGESHLEILRSHLEDVVVPPSLRYPDLSIPHHVERAILRALAKAPERRFTSAAEFANALTAVAASAAPRGPRRCTTPRMASTDDVSTLVLAAPPAASGVASTTRRPRRVARGSGARATAELSMRRAIGEAIVAGDPELVASGYLELAALLDALDRPRAAIAELHEAVDVLEGAGGGAPRDGGPIGRVLTALVQLHVSIGDGEGASQVAHALDAHTTVTMARP